MGGCLPCACGGKWQRCCNASTLPQPQLHGPHPTSQELYKYLIKQLFSGCSKGEAKALKEGGEPLMQDLHAGEGFDAEQVHCA